MVLYREQIIERVPTAKNLPIKYSAKGSNRGREVGEWRRRYRGRIYIQVSLGPSSDQVITTGFLEKLL